MSVGFRSITDGGVVQVDEDTRSWALKTKGTITYDQAIPTEGGLNGRYGVITVTSASLPLIAITGSHAVRSIYKSGSTWKFYVVGPYDSPDVTATYYVFEPSTALAETDGVAVVFDSAGNIAFQSGGKPLRIVGNAAGTYTSGRTYAAIVLEYQSSNEEEIYESEEVPLQMDRSDYMTIRGASVASNVVSYVDMDVQIVFTEPSGIGIGSWTAADPDILVVDVTNF